MPIKSTKLKKDPISEVVLIVASDLHLTLTPPPARGETQGEWLDRQAFYLNQLRLLKLRHGCPLAVAGDIFDDGWRPKHCPPELTNFAIKHLPECYAVPGQHDLPHHNYDDIQKSAYWTLVEAGKVIDLNPRDVGETDKGVFLYGFPWGKEITPLEGKRSGLRVAVVHAYVWANADTSYPGAPADKKATVLGEKLKGYDASFFGDNHKGFKVGNLINCGAFQRRRADEKDYQPHVGLLYADGHAERWPLSGIKDDKWKEDYSPPRKEEIEDLAEGLLEALWQAGDTPDFPEVLRRELEGVRPEVKRHVISALERS